MHIHLRFKAIGQSTSTQQILYIYIQISMISQWILFSPRLGMWSFDGCGMPPIALACIDEARPPAAADQWGAVELIDGYSCHGFDTISFT